MVSLTLLAAAASASASSPSCGVGDRPVATTLRETPATVQKALAHRVADRGGPFNIGDAIPRGQEPRPFMRFICGYATPAGYVVEREQGGRGYNVGEIVFDRTARGYVKHKGYSGALAYPVRSPTGERR